MPVTVEPFVPIPEDLEEVLLNCRYGEVEDPAIHHKIRKRVTRARDQDGNGVRETGMQILLSWESQLGLGFS